MFHTMLEIGRSQNLNGDLRLVASQVVKGSTLGRMSEHFLATTRKFLLFLLKSVGSRGSNNCNKLIAASATSAGIMTRTKRAATKMTTTITSRKTESISSDCTPNTESF